MPRRGAAKADSASRAPAHEPPIKDHIVEIRSNTNIMIKMHLEVKGRLTANTDIVMANHIAIDVKMDVVALAPAHLPLSTHETHP